MFWNNAVVKIHNDNKVIIGNTKNGKWVRTSAETLKIIEEVIDCNEDVEKIEFEELSDKEYIKRTIDDLLGIQAILDTNYRENEIRKVSFEITNNCNLRCVHCCVNAERNNIDMEYEEIKQALTKMIAWEPQSISISGGEPLMHKDIEKILVFLRQNYKGKIILATNGLLIRGKIVDIICKNVDQVDMSLDGVDEETCSKIRGKGVFEQVIEGINLLHNNGFYRITLSMVTGKKNEDLESRFIALNKELGTHAIIRNFAEIGRGMENKDLFIDSKEEIYIPKKFLDENISQKELGIRTCGAGKNELFVRFDGSVYPCPSYADKKFCLGTIWEVENLDDLLINKNDNIKNRMFNNDLLNREKCKCCAVAYFCITCPGEAYRLESEKEIEVYCKKVKPILYKKVWLE